MDQDKGGGNGNSGDCGDVHSTGEVNYAAERFIYRPLIAQVLRMASAKHALELRIQYRRGDECLGPGEKCLLAPQSHEARSETNVELSLAYVVPGYGVLC